MKRRNIALERLPEIVLNALQPFIKCICLKKKKKGFRPLEVKMVAKDAPFYI